jgi:hypothetical protein
MLNEQSGALMLLFKGGLLRASMVKQPYPKAINLVEQPICVPVSPGLDHRWTSGDKGRGCD